VGGGSEGGGRGFGTREMDMGSFFSGRSVGDLGGGGRGSGSEDGGGGGGGGGEEVGSAGMGGGGDLGSAGRGLAGKEMAGRAPVWRLSFGCD
jgi:hypothetical protein